MIKIKRPVYIIFTVIMYLLSLAATFIIASLLIKYSRILIFSNLPPHLSNKTYDTILNLWRLLSGGISAGILFVMWSIAAFIIRKIYLSKHVEVS